MLRSWLSWLHEDRWIWPAIDLALVIAVLLGLSWALSGLPVSNFSSTESLSGPLPKILLAGLLSLTGAVLVSGAIQIAKGRADVRRGNRLAFLAQWSLLLPATLGIALYARAVPGPSPALVDDIQVAVPASRGSLVYFGGYSSARGSDDLQVIDARSGDFLSLGNKRPLHPLVFSPDGEHAAWLDARGIVRFWREGREHIPVVPIRLSPWQLDMGLSPGGRYLVAVDATLARIFDRASGRQLAAMEVRARQTAMRFLDQRTVRLYQAIREGPLRSPLLILELDLEAATLERTGLIRSQGWPGLAIIDRAGDRVLQADGKGEVRLFDGRTGEPLATLGSLPEVREGWGRFLDDGRIALASVESSAGAGRASLRLYSPEGDAREEIDLGPAEEVFLGTQPERDTLWVNLLPEADSGTSSARWQLVTVDLYGHAVRSSTEGMQSLPLSWDGQWRKTHFRFLPPPLPAAAGEPGARLVVRDGFQLMRFDPARGEFLALPDGVSSGS